MPNPDNEPQIPKNQSSIVDDRTGLVSRDWYRFFLNLLNKANEGGGGGGSGTVTSVDVSGGGTGLTTSGGPVTTSGTIALSGTLNVAHGGTGATTASAARAALDVPQTDGTGATGTWGISVTGNAGTVTNGVYTTGSYADPTWLTSLAGAKITGDISGSAGSVANALTIGTGLSGTSYDGSAPVTIANTGVLSLTGTASQVTVSASTGAITLSLPSPINVDTSGNAGTVTNGVYTTGSYANPTWITSLASSKLTGTVAIANGGTGQSTQTEGFDALAPTTTKGDLIVNNGTDNVRLGVGTDTWVLTADSTQATGVKWAVSSGSGLTISNDTTTATNLYPTFAAATSGTMSTIYTGNAKLLYKPSTGELTSPAVVASNGIFVNSLTIGTSYTIPTGSSGVSAGTVTISSGVTVTVSSGSRWVVV